MNLQLAVNGEYFDEMLAGTKVFEFRSRTEYWRKRLEGREYDRLIITKGYPSRDNSDRRLVLPYLGYELQTITHRHFGDDPQDVFAIHVDISRRESCN